jgi:hypothetical protein
MTAKRTVTTVPLFLIPYEVSMAKVIIYLHEHELRALSELAEREYRSIKAQAALIIRKELERLEMIPLEQVIASDISTEGEG